MAQMHEGHRSRLREAAQNDPDLTTFSDFQTLEYLLSFLIPRKDTNPIAHALINEFGSLHGVLHASKQELFEVPNMTNNAATFLTSFYAFFRKSELSRQRPRPRASKVEEAVEILAPYFIERGEERAYCLTMDISDKVIQIAEISKGLVDFTTLETNRIVSLVSRTKAKRVVIAHNHPGGSLEPSKQDIDATKTIFYLLKTINVTLVDHIIFNEGEYFSFYDNGYMDGLFMSINEIFNDSDNKSELRARRPKRRYMYQDGKIGSDE